MICVPVRFELEGGATMVRAPRAADTSAAGPGAPEPPSARLLWRRLSWLAGGQICLLNHVGRQDGRAHRTAVEVAATDPWTGVRHLVCGFGATEHWFLDIQQAPAVTVRTGRRRLSATTVRAMTPEESAHCMAAYAHRRPRGVRRLLALRSIRFDGTADDLRRVGRESAPFVELVRGPRDTG
jgi:deazaflavin-dependent oxidoreductase (nitroreductase family)